MGRFLVLLLLLLPSPICAEIARVTSGEHDGFSRLVVSVGEPATWKLGRLEDGYLLQISKPGLTFDLSQTFRRIPKTRLAGVDVAASGRLRIAMACDCHAEAFEFRPGIIVIDLKSGSPRKDSPFEMPLLIDNPVIPGLPPSSKEAESGSLPLLDDLALGGMRKTIAEGIGAAATQGLVDLSTPRIARPRAVEQVSTPQSEHVRVKPPEGLETHISENAEKSPQDGACLGEDSLLLPEWSDEAPIFGQFSALRQDLVGEFDEPQPEAVAMAARRYIAMGFGAEAAQLANTFPQGLKDIPILLALARLVDGERPERNPFTGMEGCDSPAALWSVLARPSLRPGERVNRDAIYMGFSRLPLALRESLGPGLAERFRQNRDAEMVRKIRDVMARGSPSASSAVRALDASIAAEEAPREAERSFRNIASGHDELEPAALIALVDIAWKASAPVEAGLVQDLEILAQQYRGQPDDQRLHHALAVALALNGQFSRGFAAAADNQTRLIVWDILAERAGSSDLLMLASDASGAPAELPAKTRSVLVARFMDLGLPELAESWATQGRTASEDASDRLLSARLAAQRKDAAAALRGLAGLEGPEADALRGAMLMQLGLSAEAVGAFRRAGDDEAMRQALRVSRSWRAVAEQDQGIWREAAAFDSDSPVVELADKPLAHARSLVERSGQSRSALEKLLATVAGGGL
jgi:hypothetical protein